MKNNPNIILAEFTGVSRVKDLGFAWGYFGFPTILFIVSRSPEALKYLNNEICELA
jgi:hypothetical protein